MSQQINLYEGGGVKAKEWFTLPMVVAVYLLAAVVMYFFYTGLADENAQLQVQRNQAVAQYEMMQKKVEEFSKKAAPIDNSKLEAELKALKGRLEMQSQILAIFQQSISEQSAHLIDYLRAFTGQQQPGVWLTGFKVEPAVQHLSLTGQALQSQDIPAYLDLLSSQSVFAGTEFSGIQFKQVELHKPQSRTSANPASPASTPTPDPVAAAPAGKEGAGADPAAVPAASTPAPSAPGSPAAAEVPGLKVYTFEVKGRDTQATNKLVNGMSWDEFVRQTVPPQPGNQSGRQ
ncbi:PilN domain-containing protein [Methylophilus sp. DW102]|uniref:PilN domain-containing protein n=1 Tax=Methylophilus sp. DW102 TaxID=3095607 RepID=UPI003084DBA1|nr:PilN domain-containing protein [Methylophilus sp. DW102]